VGPSERRLAREAAKKGGGLVFLKVGIRFEGKKGERNGASTVGDLYLAAKGGYKSAHTRSPWDCRRGSGPSVMLRLQNEKPSCQKRERGEFDLRRGQGRPSKRVNLQKRRGGYPDWCI